MTTATTDRPALYCGTYEKYNNGSIAGKWLYLDDYEDADEFFAACAELHKDEADPEFMFQDYEFMPRELYGENLGQNELRAFEDKLSDANLTYPEKYQLKSMLSTAIDNI